MYCNHCGKAIQDDALVCAYCGTRIGTAVLSNRLVRPRLGRKIAGVCLGFAEYFHVDVTLVRVIWLSTVILSGFGLVSYGVAWIIMPQEPLLLAPANAQHATNG